MSEPPLHPGPKGPQAHPREIGPPEAPFESEGP